MWKQWEYRRIWMAAIHHVRTLRTLPRVIFKFKTVTFPPTDMIRGELACSRFACGAMLLLEGTLTVPRMYST